MTLAGIVLAWWLGDRSGKAGRAEGKEEALALFRLDREAQEYSNRRNYYLDFLSTAEAFDRMIASTNGIGACTGDDVLAARRLPHAAVGVLANGTPGARAAAETLLGVHTAAHARIGNGEILDGYEAADWKAGLREFKDAIGSDDRPTARD